MNDIALMLPEAILETLPDDSEATKQDMGQAIAGWEQQLNAALTHEDEDDGVRAVVDLLERFEDRWEAYDEFVVELRAWGQSPIYAMSWRNLHGAVIRQVYDHGDLADQIDRERHHRIFQDGIRGE